MINGVNKLVIYGVNKFITLVLSLTTVINVYLTHVPASRHIKGNSADALSLKLIKRDINSFAGVLKENAEFFIVLSVVDYLL